VQGLKLFEISNGTFILDFSLSQSKLLALVRTDNLSGMAGTCMTWKISHRQFMHRDVVAGSVASAVVVIILTRSMEGSTLLQYGIASVAGASFAILGGFSVVTFGRQEVAKLGTIATSSRGPWGRATPAIIPRLRRILRISSIQMVLILEIAEGLVEPWTYGLSYLLYLKFVMQLPDPQLGKALSGLLAVLSLPLLLLVIPVVSSICGRSCFMLGINLLCATSYLSVAFHPTSLFLAIGAVIMNDLQGAAKIIVFPFVHADASLHAELWEGVPVTGVISSLLSGVKQIAHLVMFPLPGIILHEVGYKPNGGCICGCGVACSSIVQRWNCPQDVQYVCQEGYVDHFVYGPLRRPGCTGGQPPVVLTILQVLVPGCFAATALLQGLFFLIFPIDERRAAEIKKRIIQRRNKSDMRIVDPINGCDVSSNSTSKVELLENFSKEEMLEFTNNGIRQLRSELQCYIVACTAFILAAIVAVGIYRRVAHLTQLSVPILCIALFACCLQCQRLLILMTSGTQVLSALRWEQRNRCRRVRGSRWCQHHGSTYAVQRTV